MMEASLPQLIKQKARQLGFPLAGISSVGAASTFDKFSEWVSAGKHAEMHYLAREDTLAKRKDSSLVLNGARSAIVVGLPYFSQRNELSETLPQPGFGRVAAYAWGADYHTVIPARLEQLVEYIREKTTEPFEYRIYTDSGPILERELAVKAGLGWIGRNSCLINPNLGSYFLLAEIFLTLDLTEPVSMVVDHCGGCDRCIKACPTQCIGDDRTIDARRCISYQTIENKGQIDAAVAEKTGDLFFGCDICQQVCPWNKRFSTLPADPELRVEPLTKRIELRTEETMTEQKFLEMFRQSPIKRAKRRGYVRNVLNVLANTANVESIPLMQKYLLDEDEIVRVAAERALENIKRLDEK